MAETAIPLSEIDQQLLDWMQKEHAALKERREILKNRLQANIICQATFDTVDPQVETALLEVEFIIAQLQNQAA